MDRLAEAQGLVVRQTKEWGEILTGFETRNRYTVSDVSGTPLFLAAEEAGSLLARLFLKALRPFTIHVLDPAGRSLLEVRRPFRFYFHRVEVVDADGVSIGTVQRHFSLIRRLYTVHGPGDRELFELFGPILHPWTFTIRKDGVEYGRITKKWSGLLKEGFTDADNFGIVFPPECGAKAKALLLGAVFLIDFVHFENKGNN
jgi:uncharacterized protein YxjI